MLRLAANLSTLYTEQPLETRFSAAAAAGFRAVEMQFPYELTPARLHALLKDAGVHLALFNAPPGDMQEGERGLASLPGREADFRASIGRALEYATASSCRRIHVMSGMRAQGVDYAVQLATLQDNLVTASELAASAAVTLLLEPINPVDVPGYVLGDTTTALRILDALAQPNLALQFDFYHQQIIAGDLARRFTALLPRIGHLQLADNPGRHEPGTGEINYAWLLAQVAASPYEGWVGCEYFPSRDTASSLAWARSYLHLQDG